MSDSLALSLAEKAVLKGSKSMARRKRRNRSPAFKAQVVLAAMNCDRALAELAQQYDFHPEQITDWKSQLLERAARIFDKARPEFAENLALMRRGFV